MSDKYTIKLKLVSRECWLLAIRILLILAIASACISSQILLAMVMLVVLVKLKWTADTLGFYKVSDSKLTLIIFPDGNIRLESNENTIEGYLGNRQWITSHIAVIQVIAGVKTRTLVVLSAQQDHQEDFRRFNMRIRQDFYHDAEGVQVSGK